MDPREASLEVRDAIAAVIRRDDGRYLIIRRATAVPAPGTWGVVTGRLEPGEGCAQALEREVREEVGLAVRAGVEVHVCPSSDGRWRIRWLEATLESGESGREPLTLRADEVAEARWLLAEEAARLEPMFAATRAFFLARAASEAARMPGGPPST
jgi:8-oxo-dGTP diphosphatase